MMLKTFSPSFFLMSSSLIYCIRWRNREKKSQLGQIITLIYALKYSTTWNMLTYKKLHEKLFLMNGKCRKCPKCLTIKINGSIFFLRKKEKETEKRTHYFLKKKKKKDTRLEILHKIVMLASRFQGWRHGSLRPEMKVFKRLFYI